MVDSLRVMGRGFAIVVLVSMNTYQIAHAHYLGAFVIGSAISVCWWMNARTSARSDVPHGALLYGLGAGMGTVTGMAVMRVLYGP